MGGGEGGRFPWLVGVVLVVCLLRGGDNLRVCVCAAVGPHAEWLSGCWNCSMQALLINGSCGTGMGAMGWCVQQLVPLLSLLMLQLRERPMQLELCHSLPKEQQN